MTLQALKHNVFGDNAVGGREVSTLPKRLPKFLRQCQHNGLDHLNADTA